MDISEFQQAVIQAFPDLAALPFTTLNAGWDSHALDAGGEYVFKFPKHADAEARLRKEMRFLQIIRIKVTLPVPEIKLVEGPPVFSAHRKLPGGYLLTEQYTAISGAQRSAIAEKLARFYADVHGLEVEVMKRAGALAQPSWLQPDHILEKALPHLPAELHGWARATLHDWQNMTADPHGSVFGQFDGHGWNMAFDAERGVLNGIYDFADAGIGPLHQDFIYPSFIDEDLTLRIIDFYEAITGKQIDRRRVDILTGTYRLHELAGGAHDPSEVTHARTNVEKWAHKTKTAPKDRIAR
jgi:hypothetical protein